MSPLKTLEKLIDKCRLLPQTLLFSGFNDGASLDSLYGLSVPLEQLPQFGADVGSFLLGHPSEYARTSRTMAARAPAGAPPSSPSSPQVVPT